ncbi:hypothetical protein JZX76_09395 [Haloarcula hispanica]|uniref:Uncharacterized protein n=1 Tax=Haloarcula hispanica TaxID=51589 RepID=A0A482T1C3_HALHI|nr:hypothetical protein [Haloarcula hispanica]MCJ0619716.1 hypothetical protein [Haloarcula hispanica]RYJ10178.1 hypothetical protein ELS20_09320 [Haloarcula hispanica]
MKEEMDREEDINWSEHIRKSIRERLGGSPSRKIQKLVGDYQSDLDRLWILHMFSYGMSKRYVYETAEMVFGEDKDDVVDEVEADLEERGMERMHDEIEDGLKVGDTIQNTVASYGISKIKQQVKESIKDSPREVRDGIYILSLYVRDRLDRESTSINPEGIERTWEIYTGSEVDIDDIVSTGLIYKNHYNSNAYNHWYYKIPDYGLELIEEIISDSSDFGIYHSDPKRSTLRDVINEEQSREFLRWMNGSSQYVSSYNEEDDIEDELDNREINLTMEEFAEVREDLIQSRVLLIDYSPHRSSTGNRSSRPARWSYKLTQPALDNMSEILLENGLPAQ